MRPRLSVSRSAVELIKTFEGFRGAAAKLDDGRWTIGYGHTLTAREGSTITEADAEALLLYDLIQSAHAVNEHVFAPLDQNQFDALVSFVFNIGVRAFRGSPTLRRLNEGRFLEAALAMEMWRKSDLEGERIVIDALVRRRAAEKALFLTPVGGFTPAPTPVLPPKIDYDAAALAPLTTPVETRTAMEGARAVAERAPERVFAPEEPPSASEAAAAAVIERLEAILSEPAPAATAAAGEAKRRAEPAAAPPAPTVAQPFAPTRPTGARAPPGRGRHSGGMAMALLGAIGVALVALAAVWGFRPGGAAVLGVAPQIAGMAAGGAGAVLFAISAYFLLERLGRPPGPR